MAKPSIQFALQRIVCPRLDFTLIKSPSLDKFNQGFRVSVLLVSNSELRVLFGIQMTSLELVAENAPAASIVVEVIADVKFSQEIDSPLKVKDIPMIENILAVMYPFLREKVSYCFSGNELNLILPPINTYELLAKFGDSPQFELQDARGSIEKQTQAKA